MKGLYFARRMAHFYG